MNEGGWQVLPMPERLTECPNCKTTLPRSYQVTLHRSSRGVVAGNVERVTCRHCGTLIEYEGERIRPKSGS